MKKIIGVLLMFFISSHAYTSTCMRLGHVEGKTHTVQAAPFSYTHIILPENVLQDTKPILGNDELWTTDTAGPHLYVKPNSTTDLGRTTSYSVVGESGRSYDFMLERRSHIHNNCYRVADGVLFSDTERKALGQGKKDSASETASLWKDKYIQQQQNIKDESHKAVLEALRRYRYQIYTRYEWSKSGSGFIGRDFVSDVYDDGRFTYIRVNKQNKGIMMVEASLAGQTEVIEAKYDTLNKMYTISGIFPQFTMRYGKSKVQIQRANNETAGEY